MKVGRVQTKTYTGTMESLFDLIENLKWNFGEYYLDVLSPEKELMNIKLGIRFQIGDCYQYRLPDEFEAVG